MELSDTRERMNSFVDRINEAPNVIAKHAVFSELYDVLDVVTSSLEYDEFLKKIMPLILKQLKEVDISMDAFSPEHKLRNTCLELLNRCPLNDKMEPMALEVLKCLLEILTSENDENGVLCMKILTSLFKCYKQQLENEVNSFIKIIVGIYENVPSLVASAFPEDEEDIMSATGIPSNKTSYDESNINTNDEDGLENLSTSSKKTLVKSTESFKTLSECPITMVTLFSSYKHLILVDLPTFLPLIIDLLTLEVKQQRQTREELEAKGGKLIGVSPKIKNRATFCEYVLAQIKATSFLAYVFIRGYATDVLKLHVKKVPDLVMRLLQDCPSESSSARKELLHATRHILSTSYKKLFLPKIGLMFDQNVLIGDGFTSYEMLRPLAYSTLADFIHNIRSELAMSDIEKTVKMYTSFLLDESLALTVQIMSAKLLLNLIERILTLGKKDPQEAPKAKKLLMTIIEAYTARFKILNSQHKKILQQHKVYEQNKAKKAKEIQSQIAKGRHDIDEYMVSILKSSEGLTSLVEHSEVMKRDQEGDIIMEDSSVISSNNNNAEVPNGELSKVDENSSNPESEEKVTENVSASESKSKKPEDQMLDLTDIQNLSPIVLFQTTSNDPLKDAFYLFRTLLSFLKTIIHDLKVFNPPPNDYTTMNPKMWSALSRVFSYEEVMVLKNLFHECIAGLHLFSSNPEGIDPSTVKDHFDITTPSLPVAATKDGRELMDYFAIIFMQIDSPVFNEIVESEIDFIYESLLRDSALLHVAQSFLTSEITSPNFTGILLKFLNSKLPELGNVDSNKSNILIRLFKLSFMSVNLFPITNEAVLLPHLNDLILNSLKYSTKAEEPLVYFYLIRTLFRSIGGGRFENLYRSIKPILQTLLQSLNKMIQTACRPHERDLYVELCLTVPVRLSVLAPYLNYLMKPLVYALVGFPELITQGLRTLELCIDNLTPEYFDPILEPVVGDVIKALFDLLKPQPFNHQISHTTVRILGKLGGRNRRFIEAPKDLKTKSELDIEVDGWFKIYGFNADVPLSITPGISSAADILKDYRIDLFYRKSAYNYLAAVLKLLLSSVGSVPDTLTASLQKGVKLLCADELNDNVEFNDEKIKDLRKFNNSEELLLKLLECLFYAASIDELKDDVTQLVKKVVTHFSLLQVNEALSEKRRQPHVFSVDVKQPDVCISCDILLKAIKNGLCSYLEESRSLSVEAIKQVHDIGKIIYGEDVYLEHSFITTLMRTFIHQFYSETYYEKRAGVIGIQTLLKDLMLPVEYVKNFQYGLTSGLIFVLKDTHLEAPAFITEDAKNLLFHVIETTCADVKEENLGDKHLQNSITDIVCELSNPTEIVRNVCQECLERISKLTSIPVVTLMDHAKNFLLSPIFAKPLRALPFSMQIGNVDAIIYCLRLPNSFLKFDEELFRLLHESIALVDADDISLASTQRITEYQTSQQLIKLRVVCIRLLAQALLNPEFANAQNGSIRIKVLAVFFKTMLKPSPEIIEATYEALKVVLAENSKLPKELLQNGLKPMLMNLSDHRKLTVPGLQALAKLLELLIAYFKVEIGKKLSDHLDAWCKIEVLDTLFGKEIFQQAPAKIICSIFNIFHLLPPQAGIFLNELIFKLISLEQKLRLQLDSPFRVPLAKYMDRFHTQVLTYFKNNMRSRQLVLLMCSIIQKPEAPTLRQIFEPNLKDFLNFYNEQIIENPVRTVSFFANSVDLVYVYHKLNSDDWILQNTDILIDLKKMLTTVLELINESNFNIDILQLNQSIQKFQKMYLAYLKQKKNNVPLFLEIIEFSFTHELKMLNELNFFIFDDIICSGDVTIKSEYILGCLTYAFDNSKSLKARNFVLKKVVNAILIHEYQTHNTLERLITPGNEIFSFLQDNMWHPTTMSPLLSTSAGKFDATRFELLQLTAVILKYAPSIVETLKKDIIKFAWRFIKLEDIQLKQAAYVTTSLFISKFDLPLNIITQVFVAVLRVHQIEARFMVKEALDLLAPVISNRSKNTDESTVWVNWVRRIILESDFQQNTILYQFLISQKDIFCEYKDMFIPNIISYIGRLTLLTNPSSENQTLTIDLCDLVMYWEKRSSSENIDGKDIDMENNGIIVSSSSTSLSQREAFAAFLIRFICVSNHRACETPLGSKALSVLTELLSIGYLPEAVVKLSYFEKFLVQQDLESSNILYYCMNALDVLDIIFKTKDPKWIVANLKTIQNLLDKCLHANHHDLQETLQKVLSTVLQAVKADEPSFAIEEDSDSKIFVSSISSIISDNLNGTTSVAAGVILCWTLFVNIPSQIDSLLPLLMKTFNKLCKDHLTISQPKDASAAEDARITTKLLKKVLYMLSFKVSTLGDSRRPFLSTVALLIDRSMDQNFLQKIVLIARNWVFTNEIFPTVKEKAAILTKMLAFEIRGEPHLSKQFYKIILELFENKKYNNSEITVRMEQPFLVGTRVSDIETRTKLMKILNESLDSDIKERLYYVVRDQNWEFVADYMWLNQACQLLFGACDMEHVVILKDKFPLSPLDAIERNIVLEDSDKQVENSELYKLIEEHKKFIDEIHSIKCKDLIRPLIDIFYHSPEAVRSTWVNFFPVAYKSIPRNEKYGFVRSLVALLSKDYHSKQATVRINIISTILESVSKIESLELPPHLVRYLGITYNAWYQSINLLEQIQETSTIDNSKIVETNEDALLELYSSLQEEDMFYGLWRRKAKYTESSIALSYEQIGLWDKAQQLYEAAQVKARGGFLPYSESEYELWEDNWILCASKLQHWDILTELAKHEGFTDLLLECGWRVAEWNADREALEHSVKSVMDVPTPRRQIFETFLALQQFGETKKGDQEVRRLCDEGIQLSLKKWSTMPKRFTPAHKALLHTFQQYMEFLEATQIYANLATTTVQNLDTKAQEIKRVLQAWRDRLPNIWDDISIWDDLVTWRQHAFNVINSAYLPLVPALQQANSNSNINTHAYRGYHEIAWVINRFAHVARRHNMPDVCISQLARIYTLPNIEIQEAFLKLREQAKCHYQNMNELTTGLDVISNTNLVYFGTVQKAEFFTLKGMFLSKLRAHDEANQAFATAVQIDLNLAKAWAQWGFFNDRRLSEEPKNISFASNAMSCYLQAAGLYKNSKTRKLLSRILWLLGRDDSSNSLAYAFDSFRGEIPVWYWITFIPQLLTALSHKEAFLVRKILIRIAKSYPQALHFQLRTTKEDFAVIQRQSLALARTQGETGNAEGNDPSKQTSADSSRANSQTKPQDQEKYANNRQPWEYLEELNGILKTAYPLLALSLESLVDQINQKFKTNPDEVLFRLINVLLIDGTYNYNRLPYPRENPPLPSSTEANLIRFSENLLPPNIRVKFNADFIEGKPNFEVYIKRLRFWRNRLENKLDRASKVESMEAICPNLSNFHHQKFEDIEVPGQYLLNKDNNAHFVKIGRFMPEVDFTRGTHTSHRRLTIRGHDGSLHPFAVQYPAVRHSRREERIFQLYRLLNERLRKNVQTRRRNIQFTVPIAVPLSPQVRVMSDSASFKTLHQVYDEFCAKKNLDRDAIQDFITEQLNVAHDKVLPPPDITAVKVEIFSSIHSLFIPSTLLKDYYSKIFTEFEDFWLFRKQFSSQYASFVFMTFMLSINNRSPHKIYVDEKSGNVHTLEMLPSRYSYERVNQYAKQFEANLPNSAPVFHNNEPVPFRMTPNIQKLIGDSAMEGIFSVGLFVIARALMEPDHELNTYLSLFIRDEVISWYSSINRSIVEDPHLYAIVLTNVDLIIRKVAQFGHMSSTPSVSTQYVLDAISAAVSPRNLAKCDQSFMAWL
ncbi:transcription-associated protein 1 [Kluyveromyces marxianus]|nr:transcription-associated protein 1 [Kluyveromyces marxianus]